MTSDIIKLIQDKGGVMNAAKYFGGVDILFNIASKNRELYDYVKNELSGFLTFKSDNNVNYKFEFLVLDIEIENIFEGDTYYYVEIDLVVPDVQNEFLIADWVDSYLEDHRVKFIFNSKNFEYVDTTLGKVTKVNGKKFENQSRSLDEMPPDSSVEEFVLQNRINESLKKLRTLFD